MNLRDVIAELAQRGRGKFELTITGAVRSRPEFGHPNFYQPCPLAFLCGYHGGPVFNSDFDAFRDRLGLTEAVADKIAGAADNHSSDRPTRKKLLSALGLKERTCPA